MPSREEIVEWLREAGVTAEMLYAKTKNPDDDRMNLFFERAAQVAAMRFETCAKKVTAKPFIHNSNSYLVEHCPWQDCGGCFHHEQKPAG